MRITVNFAFRSGLSLILVVVIGIFALPLTAQGSEATDDEVNKVAKRLFCPVCENIPLDACGTAACEQWREEIRTQLSQGSTEQQVINDFVNRFGDRVVGTPQDPTLRALSLVTPWIMAGVIFVIALFVFFRWRGSRQQELVSQTIRNKASLTHEEDDYRSQLEHDLEG